MAFALDGPYPSPDELQQESARLCIASALLLGWQRQKSNIALAEVTPRSHIEKDLAWYVRVHDVAVRELGAEEVEKILATYEGQHAQIQ